MTDPNTMKIHGLLTDTKCSVLKDCCEWELRKTHLKTMLSAETFTVGPTCSDTLLACRSSIRPSLVI